MENTKDLMTEECGYVLNLKLIAINEEKNAILFEDSSGIENNGCNKHHLKMFFPEIDFDFYKQYFIKIDNVFYTGDNLDDYLNNDMK